MNSLQECNISSFLSFIFLFFLFFLSTLSPKNHFTYRKYISSLLVFPSVHTSLPWKRIIYLRQKFTVLYYSLLTNYIYTYIHTLCYNTLQFDITWTIRHSGPISVLITRLNTVLYPKYLFKQMQTRVVV